MNVIPFFRKEAPAVRGWHSAELNGLLQAFAPELRGGGASGWDIGETEAGDPQFYLLGPPPEQDCVLCISRIGRLYVLENGAGHVMFENADFELLARQLGATLKTSRTRILAQVALAWGALRHAFEEKIEPLLLEGEEMLAHIAPQLSALA